MDTQRLILFFIFGFSVLMLWDAWEKENRPKPVAQTQQSTQTPAKAPAAPGAVPAPQAKPAPQTGVPAAASAAKGETIEVRTDLLVAEIDTLGGTLKRVELLKHKDSKDATK